MNSELILPKKPTLRDFQEYVISLKKIRGFHDDKRNALIFLFNEVGELGQLIVKDIANETEISEEKRQEIALELADIFIFLLDVSNQYNISLESAFIAKEDINKKRVWKAKNLIK